MAQVAAATKLDVGDIFPELTFQLLDQPDLSIPQDIGGKQSVLLFYRGEW